jgi:hypothetical protein
MNKESASYFVTEVYSASTGYDVVVVTDNNGGKRFFCGVSGYDVARILEVTGDSVILLPRVSRTVFKKTTGIDAFKNS